MIEISKIKYKMDTVFTFPLKNPKYCSSKELHKTYIYLNTIKLLNLPDQCKNKQEYIDIISPYYNKYGNDELHYRIQINFQQEYYYINRLKCSFKSFIKTYDDELQEVYKLTNYNGRGSYTVKYCKLFKIWENDTNFKVQKNK